MTSKLSEMDTLIHRLLDLEADLSSPDLANPTSALSLLLAQFMQVSKLVKSVFHINTTHAYLFLLRLCGHL